MNSAQWRGCESSGELFHQLLKAGRLDGRRTRLVYCALARTYWGDLDVRCRGAVETAEAFAQGKATSEELRAAQAEANVSLDVASRRFLNDLREAGGKFRKRVKESSAAALAAAVAAHATAEDVATVPYPAINFESPFEAYDADREVLHHIEAHPELVSEVYADPFQPPWVDPAWLAWNDGLVGAMARDIAEAGLYQEMPVLGDALEEAGCRDAAILRHLRDEGPHFLGCWVLDALCGRR